MKTLRELMDSWEDGSLSPEDRRQLKGWLRQPDTRAQIREECCFYGLLHEVLSRAEPVLRAQPETEPATAHNQFPRRPASFFGRWLAAPFHARPALAWSFFALLLVAGFCIWYFRPAPLGYISQSGEGVLITHAGKNYPARPGATLAAGDSVVVPQFASAAFRWKSEASRFCLSPETEIRVNQTRDGKQLNLSNGVLKAVVVRQAPRQPLVVTSPGAVAKVLGTQFTLSTSSKGDRLEVVEGAVEFADVQHQRPSVTLHAGDSAAALRGLPIQVEPIGGAAWWQVWVAGTSALADDLPVGSNTLYQDYLGAAYTLVWSYPFISDWSRRYRESVRGFITPEQTGVYTFYMMSQEASELWLSRDTSPANKLRIAYTPARASGAPLAETWNWVLRPGLDQTALRGKPWNKFPAQKSAPQKLIAGQRYYFEALHELVPGDCLAVVWSRPDDDFPAETVPGRVLSPLRH